MSAPELQESTLSNDPPLSKEVSPLPYRFAKHHGILVTSFEPPVTAIHLPNCPSLARLEVRRHLGIPICYEQVSVQEFNERLQHYYAHEPGQAQQTMDDMGDDLDLMHIAQQMPEPEDLLESADEAPIIRLINALLAEAVKEDASDIHIEPYEYRLVVRLRVDGVLREILQPQRSLAPLIISRIKVMAKLDIAEKRLPQDGRISLRIGGRAVDIRVSTLPSGHGERVVLRLLDKKAERLDVAQLGMETSDLTLLERLICHPHGIILVTGQTGSGKTTTLYAILNRLNNQSRNIITIEDPIEYHLDGIGQTQVNNKVALSFARGLRAILRQDPDVVMVGEIRDLETAEIAVQASLTGHLVFSTLHTNTAIGSITRLRDMGVETFLLSSSVIGVLAQRLVRRLCRHCRKVRTATATDCSLLEITQKKAASTRLYSAQGCSECNHTGYKGRIGLFELISIDDHLREMIHNSAREYEMESYVRGFSRGIRQSGQEKVLAGDTTVEEILRVTQKT